MISPQHTGKFNQGSQSACQSNQALPGPNLIHINGLELVDSSASEPDNTDRKCQANQGTVPADQFGSIRRVLNGVTLHDLMIMLLDTHTLSKPMTTTVAIVNTT